MRIEYVSAKQPRDNGFVIKQNEILLLFSCKQYYNLSLYSFHDDSCVIDTTSQSICVDPAQPAAQARINGTPHLDNHLACKPITNKYFDILNNESDLWLQFTCEEENWLVYWCPKHILRWAGVNRLSRNSMMATISNSTLSQNLIQKNAQNVLHDVHWVFEIGQSVLQVSGHSEQPLQQWLRTYPLR